MICTRCGQREANPEAEAAALAAKGGPVFPAGVCFPCAWKDPGLQPGLREYPERKNAEHIRRVRELLARPLEFIDRLVASFRGPGRPTRAWSWRRAWGI